jgi:2-oxoglutarate dehydrogenase E2 component (dihydrolipoamide succinyltransferase)
MAIELKIPQIGESISEVEIGDWLKKEGDDVAKDENVVTIESEKATVELPAPDAGKISKILKRKGEIAKVGEVIGFVDANGEAKSQSKESKRAAAAQPAVSTEAKKETQKAESKKEPLPKTKEITSADIGGRLRKESSHVAESVQPKQPSGTSQQVSGREEEVVPMTMLRRTVAKHLVEAQQTMAMLTTFNEVDMSAVMALRKEFAEKFVEKYGVKPGFMSFFVKACVDALKSIPQVNAEIRGNNIVYHNYCDIGVAIGGGKGLVVPVLRNAERMSFAEIEIAIGELAKRAKETN